MEKISRVVLAVLAGLGVSLAGVADLLSLYPSTREAQPWVLGLLVVVGVCLGGLTYWGVEWAQTELKRLRARLALAEQQARLQHCTDRVRVALGLELQRSLNETVPFTFSWRAAVVDPVTRDFLCPGFVHTGTRHPLFDTHEASWATSPCAAVTVLRESDGHVVAAIATPVDSADWQVCLEVFMEMKDLQNSTQRQPITHAAEQLGTAPILKEEVRHLMKERQRLADARGYLRVA